jgi:DNA-binding protein HU-beta
MNKAELIAMITEKCDLTKAQVETAFKATFDAIAEVLSKQDKVTIPGFGGFTSKKRPARKGRNPSTGQEMLIPETVVASFKAAVQLKEIINS